MRPNLICGLFLLVAAVSWAQPGAKNVHVITHIDVAPTFTVQTENLLKQFAADSKKDAGFVRFEVLQQDARGNHLVMDEVWESREAFEAHNALAHSKKFRETLQPFLGSPFDVRLHSTLQ